MIMETPPARHSNRKAHGGQGGRCGYRSLWLVLVMTLVAALGACSKGEERMKAYLDDGRRLFEQGNDVKARLELKNALQIDPKIAEAHYLLGRIAEREKDWRRTYAEYKAAVDLDPGLRDARLRLGRLSLLAGRPAEALEMAEALLASRPDDPDARVLKAMVHARQDKLDQAIETARKVLEDRPGQSDAAILLGTLYQRQGKTAEAMAVLRDALEASPRNAALYLAMAQLNILAGQRPEAGKWLRRLVELEPDNPIHRRRLALFLQSNGQTAEAEKILRHDLEAAPDDDERLLTLADFLAKYRTVADAETLLEQAIERRPDDMPRRFALARLYEVAQMPAKAQAVYRAILERDVDERSELSARDGLARTLLETGQTEQSQRLVDEVIERNPGDHEALLVRGRLAMKRHDLPAAIADFRSLLRDIPNSPEILRLLAQAQLLDGQPELALSNLDKAITASPQDSELRLAKARLQVSRKDQAGALKTLKELLAMTPDFAPAIDLQTRLLAARQDWGQAMASAKRLIESSPGRPQGYLQLGEIELRNRQFDKAAIAYQKAIELAPDSFEAWSGLLRSLASSGRTGEARKRIEALLAKDSGHPFAHELLGEIEQSAGHVDAAIEAYQRAIENNPSWPLPVVRLADLHQRNNAVGKALAVYRKAVEGRDQPLLSIRLAELESRHGAPDKAIEVYRGLIARHPDLDVAANNLAVLLIETHPGDESARREALALARRFESAENPYFLDTLGWVYYRVGQVDKARQTLERAAATGTNLPALHYHLARLYLDDGETAKARKALRRAVSGPAFPEREQAQALLATLDAP